MAKPSLVLCVPTLNEEESIGPLLDAIPRDVVDEIIVADGGSTDRTRMIAEAKGARVIEAGRGYGRACLVAAQSAHPTNPYSSTWMGTAPTIRR